MDKRGDVLSMYWYVMLVIVAAGIYIMVKVFYSGAYDIRNIEAETLSTKIADCLSWQGQLRESIWNNSFLINSDNLLEICNLNFDVEEFGEWGQQTQYYAEISFYTPENIGSPILVADAGNKNWKSYCEIQEEETYKNLVRCSEKRIYALNKNNDQFLIKILSSVRKIEKNVT